MKSREQKPSNNPQTKDPSTEENLSDTLFTREVPTDLDKIDGQFDLSLNNPFSGLLSKKDDEEENKENANGEEVVEGEEGEKKADESKKEEVKVDDEEPTTPDEPGRSA